MSDLEPLRMRLARFAHERDWEQFHTPKNLAMALIAEAAELVEHFQWLTPEESANLSDQRREAVALELADILIYLIRAADILEIDLPAAAWRKIAINEHRYPAARVRGDARRASEYPNAADSSNPVDLPDAAKPHPPGSPPDDDR
jgi:NTP pyrophosphatase (non-canonical NTP hydrolase)